MNIMSEKQEDFMKLKKAGEVLNIGKCRFFDGNKECERSLYLDVYNREYWVRYDHEYLLYRPYTAQPYIKDGYVIGRIVINYI